MFTKSTDSCIMNTVNFIFKKIIILIKKVSNNDDNKTHTHTYIQSYKNLIIFSQAILLNGHDHGPVYTNVSGLCHVTICMYLRQVAVQVFKFSSFISVVMPTFHHHLVYFIRAGVGLF